MSKILFATVLINFKSDSVELVKESLVRNLQFSLFHSIIERGKIEFLKTLHLVLTLEISLI